MNCDSQIHDELKSMEEWKCPFCDQPLAEVDKAVEPCCSEQNMETVNGMNICVNCGSVHGYVNVSEYFEFHDNMHRIRRKSVYNRKYYIDNVLDNMYCENNLQLTYHQRKKIHKVFIEIDSVLHKVNNGRKRMISIKYFFKQLFEMLGLPYKDINVTKSKRTLSSYEQFWNRVLSLIGNRIQSIINL